jgi:hypothetical protein
MVVKKDATSPSRSPITHASAIVTRRREEKGERKA